MQLDSFREETLKKPFAIYVLVLATLSLTMCGGDEPLVGAGESFNTLSSQPTAETMSDAILRSFGFHPPLNRLVARKIRQEFIRRALDLGLDPERTKETWDFMERDCSGGGSATSQLITYTATNVRYEFAITDCVVSLELNGTQYSETINGTVVITLNTESGDLYSAANNVALTVEGDLGFNADCDLSATAVDSGAYTASSTFSGNCTFRDKNDATIQGTAEELRSLLFIGF